MFSCDLFGEQMVVTSVHGQIRSHDKAIEYGFTGKNDEST